MALFISDDDQAMQYLNDWDKNIPNLDVVDDYRTETKQVRACRGNSVPFSFGDVSGIDHQIIIICFFSST